MDIADVDARLVTAISLWVIGLAVILFCLRVWWTHPVNRAFLFGPFLTPDGLKLVLRGLKPLFLLGMLAIAGGFGRFAYWMHTRGQVESETAAVAGVAEAMISLFTAGALLAFMRKSWRQRKSAK